MGPTCHPTSLTSVSFLSTDIARKLQGVSLQPDPTQVKVAGGVLLSRSNSLEEITINFIMIWPSIIET